MSEGQEQSVFIEKVNTLHRHFEGVSEKLETVQRGQERLEDNDRAFDRRLGELEVKQVREQGLLATHIATTAIHIEGTRADVQGMRQELIAHGVQEDKDRRTMLWFVFVTMAASIGGLAKMVFFSGGGG
jgi:hypothetical protein